MNDELAALRQMLEKISADLDNKLIGDFSIKTAHNNRRVTMIDPREGARAYIRLMALVAVLGIISALVTYVFYRPGQPGN